MRGSREEKADSASSGEDEESLRELKQAIQASSKGAKKTKNKCQLHELCTVNGIKFEKLQKGAGKNVASLEMFFSGFPKIIGMENFPDLQNLTLMGQQITMLENLDCLSNLTELCVSESKITAISGLDGCRKLKKLFLYDNKITKIENISHLEQLSVLWLNNNNIIAIEEAKYVIVEREPRDNIWIYHYKCVEGTRQTNYLQSLSPTITGDSLTAASSVYGNCIHIEATEKLMESFDRENNIIPSLARDTHSHDHTYQEEHHDLLPLNGNNFTIFVHGNKQHGVVGLQGALITCFICDHQCHNCEHVTKVAESEETMEHRMWDFLVYFFAERNFQESTESVAVATTRKEWKIRSVSCLKKIPFHLSTTQKSILLWKRFFVAKCQLLIWCCLLPTCLPPAQSVHRSALVRLHKLCAF